MPACWEEPCLVGEPHQRRIVWLLSLLVRVFRLSVGVEEGLVVAEGELVPSIPSLLRPNTHEQTHGNGVGTVNPLLYAPLPLSSLCTSHDLSNFKWLCEQ